jgi:hypothetical protein
VPRRPDKPAGENPYVTRHDIVRHGQVRAVHSRSNGDDVDAIVLLEDDDKIVEKLFKGFEEAGG